MQNSNLPFLVQVHEADGVGMIHANVWKKGTCTVKITLGLQTESCRISTVSWKKCTWYGCWMSCYIVLSLEYMRGSNRSSQCPELTLSCVLLTLTREQIQFSKLWSTTGLKSRILIWKRKALYFTPTATYRSELHTAESSLDLGFLVKYSIKAPKIKAV